jgi:acyl-CoA thioester hydrolase
MSHAGKPLEVRIYYEDTDFSGQVHHASYLRFLERGRTEWPRRRGFEHRELERSSGVAFAVRSLQIDYLAPALMDDLLKVETEISVLRGASIQFLQRIFRDDDELVAATVLVAVIRDGRPSRIPDPLRRAQAQPASRQECRGSKARSKRSANESIRSPSRSSRSWISARFGSAPIVSRRR